MKKSSFIPAIIWLVISFILLVIPGNDLPHNSFFDVPYFDKYVHFCMFFLLTFLFCLPFFKLSELTTVIFSWFTRIAMFVILYGIIMEFVQKYAVTDRSFDVTDILFDSIGSVAGLIAVRRNYIKKIGPDGNQGRNQN